MVQQREDAEDITQDVFATVYKSILSFNNQSTIATWIYRIAVNRSLDHLRTVSRKRKTGIHVASTDELKRAESLHDGSFQHPGIRLEQRENARLLFAAISTLPENQKTAFVLAHVEGLPQKDVAEVMELSLKAVESLLQRAKQNLRDELGKYYDRRKNEKHTSK